MDNSNSVLNRIKIQNDINLYIHALGIGFDWCIHNLLSQIIILLSFILVNIVSFSIFKRKKYLNLLSGWMEKTYFLLI